MKRWGNLAQFSIRAVRHNLLLSQINKETGSVFAPRREGNQRSELAEGTEFLVEHRDMFLNHSLIGGCEATDLYIEDRLNLHLIEA